MASRMQLLSGFAVLLLAVVIAGAAVSIADVKGLSEQARAGDKGAVAELFEITMAPERAVRDEATKQLAAVPTAGPYLVSRLQDENRDVRENAAGILGMIKHKAAVPELERALETWPNRRYVAAISLGRIGLLRSVPVLIRHMGDEDELIRKNCIRALMKYGADKEVQNQVKAALHHQNNRVKIGAAIVIGEIGAVDASDELLVNLKSTDHDVRASAAYALAKSNDKRVIPALIATAKDGYWRVRQGAVTSLGIVAAPGDKGVKSALEECLDDKSPAVREWAARSLENVTGQRYKYKNEEGELVPPYNLYR